MNDREGASRESLKKKDETKNTLQIANCKLQIANRKFFRPQTKSKHPHLLKEETGIAEFFSYK
jgi:hypothetical protein